MSILKSLMSEMLLRLSALQSDRVGEEFKEKDVLFSDLIIPFTFLRGKNEITENGLYHRSGRKNNHSDKNTWRGDCFLKLCLINYQHLSKIDNTYCPCRISTPDCGADLTT